MGATRKEEGKRRNKNTKVTRGEERDCGVPKARQSKYKKREKQKQARKKKTHINNTLNTPNGAANDRSNPGAQPHGLGLGSQHAQHLRVCGDEPADRIGDGGGVRALEPVLWVRVRDGRLGRHGGDAVDGGLYHAVEATDYLLLGPGNWLLLPDHIIDSTDWGWD